MKSSRIAKLRGIIKEKNINSLIINNINNIRYLTGYKGDFGYFVLNDRESVFLTSSLFTEEAKNTLIDGIPVVEIKEDIFKSLAELGISFLGEKVGFETESVIFSFYEKMKNAVGPSELVPSKDVVESIRYCKDDSEINAIMDSQKIIEITFDQVIGIVREGMDEMELANELDYLMRKNGAERQSFSTIIAAGPNASKPHAIPSGRKIKKGDMIIFDIGAMLDDYASDMTRTVVFGKADNKFKEVYYAVLDAQNASMDIIKSGVKCSDADKAARDCLVSRGFGEYFIHTTGHGIGLEVHEFPRLSKTNHTELKENMVVTVEPGVYIPGWGGVRIENMVAVKNDGCFNLTKTTRELIEL